MVAVECRVELSPSICDTDSEDHIAFVCIDRSDVLPTTLRCGLYVVAIDVTACEALNVTRLPVTANLEAVVREKVDGFSPGTPVALVSTCALPARTARQALRAVGVDRRNLSIDVQLVAITQSCYPQETLAVTEDCRSSPIQLCVLATSNST